MILMIVNSFSQFDLQKGSKRLFHSKLCYDCPSAISINHDARSCKNRMKYKVCKKDTHSLCMVIKQRKVRLSSRMVTLQKNQK